MPSLRSKCPIGFLLLVVLCALPGCGGGGSTPPVEPTITSVSASCAPSSINTKQTAQCTATVSGTGNYSSAVTWSVVGGNITSAGLFSPSDLAETAVVTATSFADRTKAGSANVTVTPAPAITSVSVTCTPVAVGEGQTSQCSATVQGVGAFDPSVTWTTTLGAVSSTAADNSQFTAPSNATGSATLTATSNQDATKTGSTEITVTLPPPVDAFQVTGPGGGDILAFVVDPSSPQTMYASIFDSGIFKSIDGGATWKDLSTTYPATPNLAYGLVYGLAVSARSGTVYSMFASSSGATGDQVYKSSDGGASWSLVASLPASSSNLVTAMSLDPLNDSTLYVQDSKDNFFVSRDAGSTWSALTVPTTCGGTITADIATEGKLFFGTCSGLYASNDGGSTWTFLNIVDTYGGVSIGSIVQAPSNPSRLYTNAFPGIWKSPDGGKTWSLILSGYSIGGLIVEPANADQLFVWGSEFSYGTLQGIHGLVKTTDGGKTWAQICYPKIDPDFSTHYYPWVGALNLVSTSPDVFIGVAADHLWRMNMANNSIQETDSGFTGNFGLQVAVDPSQPSTLYLAASNGGGISKSSDAGKTWTTLLNADASAVAVDPFNSNHLLASIGLFDPWQSTNSPLQASHDAGATWQDAPTPACGPSQIVFDPKSSGTLYMVCGSSGVAKSIDGGQTWNYVNSGLNPSSTFIRIMAISPANSQALIAGTAKGIFKSSDGGATWTQKNSSLAPISIAFDPNNPNVVYAGGNQLVKSIDGGDSWTSVDLGQSNIVSVTVAVDPKVANTLFAVATAGADIPASQVGWSPDAGTTWFWLDNGLKDILLGGNVASIAGPVNFLPAIAKTSPEILYLPSGTVGIVSLELQH